MKTFCLLTALLCLLTAPISSQPANQRPLQEQLDVWLNPNTPSQRKLDTFLELFGRNEFVEALLKRHGSNRKAVADALVYSFDHGHFGHQCAALQLGMWMQDRACYSAMIEPALRSPNYEVRSIALGAAAFFDDRSEVVVSSIAAEIGNTNLSNARDTASKLAVKWNLPEAIEPLLSLTTHTNVTVASMAAGSLSAYAYLPPETLPKLEAALARAEYKATNMVRYTNTTLFPGQPVSHAWAVDGLVVALRKAKEKAQLPAPPGAEPAKTQDTAKKAAKPAVDGKPTPATGPMTQKDSPASTGTSGNAGRSNLLLFSGLASIAVIAWFLLKGRLR